MSRPQRQRRMSSRELIASNGAAPLAARQPPPPKTTPAAAPPPPTGNGGGGGDGGPRGRARRGSFKDKLKSMGGAARNMWRRKSVMSRSMEKAYGSSAAAPPSGYGNYGDEYDDDEYDADEAPLEPPTHRGFVGSSLTVLDDGETSPQTMRVFLMNNSYFDFDIAPDTLAGEVCLEMRKILGLQNDAMCSMFTYTRGTYYLLQDQAIVLDAVRKWDPADAETGASRLVYKARMYVPDGALVAEAAATVDAAAGAHRLSFIDAVHRTITGLYSIPTEKAPLLAALQLQSAVGDYDADVHRPNYIISTGMENYIAPALMDQFYDDNALEDAIRAQHRKLLGTSRLAAERRYIAELMDLVPYFGASFFACKAMVQETEAEEDRSDPVPAIMAISFDGIFLLSGWNLSQQDYFSYETITKWTVASNPDLFAFSIHDKYIYFLLCERPNAVEDCVQMHISTIISLRQGTAMPRRRDENQIMSLKAQMPASRKAPAPSTSSDGNAYSDLPAGWEALADPSTGKTYYWNEDTGETSWDRPMAAAEGPAPTAPAAAKVETQGSLPPAPEEDAPKTKTRRRITRRRASALQSMVRRRASVSMVMAVSNSKTTLKEVGTVAKEGEGEEVVASMQVIYGIGWKEHESQQKPDKRGAAGGKIIGDNVVLDKSRNVK